MEYVNNVYVKFYYGDYLMHHCFDLDYFTPIKKHIHTNYFIILIDLNDLKCFRKLFSNTFKTSWMLI